MQHTPGFHLGDNGDCGNYLYRQVSHIPPDISFLKASTFALNASLWLYCNMSHVRMPLSTHVASSSPPLQGGSGISPKGTGLSNTSSHTWLICHMQMFLINTPGNDPFAGTFSCHPRLVLCSKCHKWGPQLSWQRWWSWIKNKITKLHQRLKRDVPFVWILE